MIHRKKKPAPSPALPIAPLIDAVFLLLVYFILTTTLERPEAGLSFELPGAAALDEPLGFTDEQVIEIDTEGAVWLNGWRCAEPKDVRMDALAAALSRWRQACEASQSKPQTILSPAPKTPHERVVRALDACARAGIERARFALEPPRLGQANRHL